jgi:hypothetical protein
MRAIVFSTLFFFCLALVGCSGESTANTTSASPAPQAKPPGTRELVLVELFTSEGCGNCPPADAQLAFLDTAQPVQGADVITLGFHVDYFNDRGWKDEYSSPVFTARQNKYSKRLKLDSIYTPQMIVDGQKQFIGSNGGQAADVIAKAAVPVKGNVDVEVNEKRVEINVQNISKHEAATIYLAATEDNIVSNVKAGNNNGKTLKHSSVVRGMAEIATLTATQSGIKTSVDIKLDPKWKKENTRYVVFVQENESGRVIAVGRTKTK